MTPLAFALALVGCAPDANDQGPACAEEVTFFADVDADGHGDPLTTVAACDAPDGYTTGSDDCDDGNADVHPGADELCNEIDDDCDASIDEDAVDATSWYEDTDLDGFGSDVTVVACARPSGHLDVGGDCDDGNPEINPDADELCNTTDDDCDGAIDEEPIDGVTVYDDTDEDGYGAGPAILTCTPTADQVLIDGDCEPAHRSMHPGATEECNSIDDNCDGRVDEDDPLLVATTYYADDDGDGYGNPKDIVASCDAVEGYTKYDWYFDCDDTDAAINREGTEYCDGVDNDCDGSVDDSLVYADWYADDDGDGYGDPDDTMNDYCGPPPTGYVRLASDCDDTVAATHPGSSELCGNDADDDCDGGSDNCVLGYTDLFDFVGGDFDAMGERLAVADANGDEVADLVVSEPTHDRIGSALLAVDLAGGSTSLGDLLELEGTTEDSQFGTGLGGGDVNLDEVDDILAGAPGSGDAYLFLGPVTSDRAATDADVILEADSAGSDVDVVDFDADGDPDVAVGACCDSLYVGAVYVASGPVSADVDLGADATWIFDGPSADDRVGDQVVDAGDLNGDGIHDLAIGAESGDGAVYVVDGGTATGAYSVDLVASVAITGPDLDSHFGSALATADYDGDGTLDVVVGAHQADSSGGGVYAFLGPLSGALEITDADATWLAGSGGEWLGRAVAAGDIDGDGSTDLALGAPGGDPGAVYFQLGLASGTVEVSTLPSIVGNDDLPGYSIALLPDWTGDGGAEVVFGTPDASWEGGVGGGFGVLSSDELH